MRRRWKHYCVATAAMLAMASSAAAQRDSVKTPWGDPDLQGVWDFRTITPFERVSARLLSTNSLVTFRRRSSQCSETNPSPCGK